MSLQALRFTKDRLREKLFHPFYVITEQDVSMKYAHIILLCHFERSEKHSNKFSTEYNPIMKKYWVYMLRRKDGTYYTGITNSVTKRLWQHKNGIHPNSYTAQRLPVELVYSTMFNDIWEAIRWEKILKDWRREKKEALIRGDYEIIAELAASKKSPADSSIKKSSRSARTDNINT